MAIPACRCARCLHCTCITSLQTNNHLLRVLLLLPTMEIGAILIFEKTIRHQVIIPLVFWMTEKGVEDIKC